MDPLTTSRRDAAIREALRLYPTVSPVLAGWVFDHVEAIGEEEMSKRIIAGYYEKNNDE